MAVTASSPSFPFVRGVMRTTHVQAPASTMINPGDAIYIVPSGGIEASCGIASAYPWASSLGNTQVNFAAQFVGLSLDQRLSTDATTGRRIVVMTEGDCNLAVASGGLATALPVGTFMAPAQDVGNNLLDQVYTQATGGGQVAKIIEFAPAGATSVVAHVQGTLELGQCR